MPWGFAGARREARTCRSARPGLSDEDGLAPAAAALRGLPLAERAVRATEEPQVDAGLVEGVATTGEAPHRLAGLEVADADGALLLGTRSHSCS